jgi:hypothetical protein
MTAIPGDINPMPPQAETVTTTDTTNADAPQLTEEQAAEREEQDFAAGFKVASSERLPVAETRPREGKTETPTGEAAPAPKSEATDPPAPKTEETPKPPDDPEVPGLGMKASEVRAALKKADDSVASLKTELGTLRDQAMGHVGNLKKAIDSLKTNPVTGKPQTVTAEQLKRVAGEFPEIATLLAEDLSGLVLGSSTQSIRTPSRRSSTRACRSRRRPFAAKRKSTCSRHCIATGERFASPRSSGNGRPRCRRKP